MNWDEGRVSSIDLITDEPVMNEEVLRDLFVSFTQTFSIGGEYPYRAQDEPIHIEHLNTFDVRLSEFLSRDPLKFLNIVEPVRPRISLISEKRCERSLNSCNLNKIVRLSGIVTGASKVFLHPKKLFLSCKNCLKSMMVDPDGVTRSCDPQCGLDPFTLIVERSVVVDAQFVKLQLCSFDADENDDECDQCWSDTDHGEVFTLMVEGRMTNWLVPGSFVTVTGIHLKGNSNYVRVIGVVFKEHKLEQNFTRSDIERFENINKERLVRSVAPMVYGMDDVKKIILALLFSGGARKRAQGDESASQIRKNLNIFLVGDPGVAKSQILKFVTSVAPISVYTCGKGSSAVGLTASVLRDKNGFYLEGGALVHADEGVCCIDEFDKMDYTDRVVLHEAMEQQTISIAKASINTVLNARCSVLAAANEGVFDETLISRFDSVVLIKDNASRKDVRVANHVLNVHMGKEGDKATKDDLIDTQTFKRYILYCKNNFNPSLSDAAKRKLRGYFHSIRRYPLITVRQLESLIRISESIARMDRRTTVTVEDASEAIRLFSLSTMEMVKEYDLKCNVAL